MREEIWKDVIGFEGIYKVSNLGNVYSLPRVWRSANGNTRRHNGKILSQKNRGRYPRVILCKNGIITHESIHILVAKSFLNFESNKGFIVDHINNISNDNRLENLQIITRRENTVKDLQKKSNLPTGVDKLPGGRYRSRVVYDKRKINIGVFNCETSAHIGYLKFIKNIR